MSSLRSSTKLLAVAIVALVVAASLPITVQAQTSLNPIVVLYDASHLQQFDAFDEENGLKLMLDMVNSSTRYIVRVHDNGPINESVLEDVDILIVADPDRSGEFEASEIEAISDMMKNGSSLLVMGDPAIDQNSTYWSEQPFTDLGDNIAVNRFLDALNITGVRFSINATGEDRYWADSMFDYDHALNETYPQVIQLDSTTWDTLHPIFHDINELVVMTATLKPIDTASAIAWGYDTSFAQYRKGPFTFANISYPNMTLDEFKQKPLSYSAINGTYPPWLAAFEFEGSRVVVCGSTIMFTGRHLDLPESDERSEQRWFYAADNSRLFMNMLDWLSTDFVEPPNAIYPMFLISSVILLVGVAYYVFKKIR
ncbi:MAG: Gldg family protein [Candidatus Thorarchaeota archaeon]